MFTPSFMTTSSPQTNNWLERVEKLFIRYGIKSITMDDVAADLGISKKTLYQMVESKDALVINVLQHHISREKATCLDLAKLAPNALEEIFIIMDSNSQEMAQMKHNIINDLQKYHREAWELIQKFHFEFVFKVIRENLFVEGKRVYTVRILISISWQSFIWLPLLACLIHRFFRRVLIPGLSYSKNICCTICMALCPPKDLPI